MELEIPGLTGNEILRDYKGIPSQTDSGHNRELKASPGHPFRRLDFSLRRNFPAIFFHLIQDASHLFPVGLSGLSRFSLMFDVTSRGG